MYNNRKTVKSLLSEGTADIDATVMGWVRTFRNNQFIALNDGSTNDNLQIVVRLGMFDDTIIKKINTGACIKVTGKILSSIGKGQSIELEAESLEILGESNSEVFPLQPKKHSLEFLREIAHLRFRTKTFASVFRVRNSLSFAVHKFFNERDFIYIHTPIITASDAEGAGEMFRVTTLPLDGSAIGDDGNINFKEDFFGRSTNLTVSGQLEGELAATALGNIYTFGPTFRAENSNTTRHLAEFWMIEPEVAFADLEDNMNLAEEFIKYIISHALKTNLADIQFLSERLQEEENSKPVADRSMPLMEKLEFVINNDFERISYTEAIDILRNSNHNKKKKFNYLINEWGVDLQSEHERYLVEKHFK
ncbi:MAG: asparagine--tRNA ligase, partial [Ferruginibacter sp.]